MRKVFLILCALSLATGCSRNEKDDSTSQIVDPATRKNDEYLKKGGWNMVWNDEFNRDDIFSTGIWSKIWTCTTSDWCNTMSKDPSLYEIKNGSLILLGKPSPESTKDNPKYITGGVFTQGKKYFQNGRLEIRCKLEGHQGAWPALWMIPDDSTPWPTGGEIDIVERLNYDPFVYHTLHSPYTQAGKKDPSKKDNPPSHTKAAINPDDYNIYAVELDTNEVRFYVNGEQTFSYARVPGKESQGQFLFNRPYMLLIDMQLGGKWVGEVKPFTKPIRMYVDWVRFYQK